MVPVRQERAFDRYPLPMPDVPTLAAFATAAMILFIVPGPVVLYVITRSVAQGTRAGLVSVVGVHLASTVHIAAAVAGLSTLLAASATAFTIVKWAGAAYLVYLGIRALTTSERAEDSSGTVRSLGLRTVFRQGFVVNLLNPKTAVFFLAFVPQFIDPARNTTTQLLVLGAVFVTLGFLSDGMYAFAAGSLGDRLQRASWWRRGSKWVSGVTYLGLGAVAALGSGPDS